MAIRHLSLVITLSAIGLVDAAYLSYARFTTNPLSCNILEGCNIVALSPYSLLFGYVPLAYLGFIFYAAVLVLSALYMRTPTALVHRALVCAGGLGLLSSIYFVYIQAFVIKAFCVYCLVSAVLATTVFLLLVHHYIRIRPEREAQRTLF